VNKSFSLLQGMTYAAPAGVPAVKQVIARITVDGAPTTVESPSSAIPEL
jgi:hypothetical protein